MSEISEIQNAYLSLKGRLSSLAPSALMRRDTAVLAAASLGYPNTRVEDWKYTSLRSFHEKGFRVATKLPKTDAAIADLVEVQKKLIPNWIHLVFIDGELSIGLSDTRKAGEGVSIKTLFESESSDEGKWRDLDSASGMHQIFAQMAVGLAVHGLVIKVANRTVVSAPIHIMHVVTPAWEGLSSSQRVILEVGRLSQVSVIEEFCTIGPTSYHLNSLTQLVVEEGVLVGYCRMDGSIL